MPGVWEQAPTVTPQIARTALTAGLVDAILPVGGKMVSLGGVAPLQSTTFVDTSGPTNAVNYKFKAPVKAYDSSVPSYSLRTSAPSPFAISGSTLKECTILVLWRSDAIISATRFFFGYGLGSSANPVFALGTDASALHFSYFVRDTAGTSQLTSGALTLAGSTEYTVIGTRSEKLNFHRIYANGVQDLSTTATAIGTVSFDRACLGALARTTVGLASGGQVALALAWNRALSPSEVAALSANPWQIFANPANEARFGVAPSGGVTGDATWTEANDIWAATGTAIVDGSGAWTEVNDSWAIAGSVIVAGSGAWTELNDSWAISGSVIVAGSLAWTEAQDVWAAAGSVATGPVGDAAWTEANDTWALAGSVIIDGSVAWTEGNDLWNVQGSLNPLGAVAWTEANDIWNATGTVSQPALNGDIGWVEANDNWNIQAQSGGAQGDNFLPLTRKQLQAEQKRRRKERQQQEAGWQEKTAQADALAAEIRSHLLPSKTIAEVINEADAEVLTDDDEDAEIELLLLA